MNRRRLQLVQLALSAVCLASTPGLAGFVSKEKAPPKVLAAPFSGVISPVAAEFIEEAVERAREGGFNAVVIQLDTPGGLDTSMRQAVKSIMASKVPVIVYVHPSGSRAASAGVFITMAAHVAAMAPGTNIGAAHPVLLAGGGARPRMPSADKKEKDEKPDETMESKMVNDAAAYLRSIARERGRNEDWAAQAVSVSSSVQASEAVRMKIVDLVAADMESLLREVDGRKLAGFKDPLRTAGAVVERLEMTQRQRILAALSDPNVAMILMSLGAAGLFIELYNPGLILPGIVGAIALILAFYSFHTLSASYAGVLLILVGLIFLLLEIKVTSFGLLALGGITAAVLGVLMLFQHQPLGGLQVAWSVIAGSLGGLLLVVGLCSYLVYQAYRRKTQTGAEGMIGAHGTAVTALTPKGKVRVSGELWDAVAPETVLEGAEIIIDGVQGLTLRVHAR